LTFDIATARQIATIYSEDKDFEKGLTESFAQTCFFLADNPECISWKGKNMPSIDTEDGLTILAERYFSSYRKSDFPADPNTIPDEMVSIVMQKAYEYSSEQCEQIKIDHQHSMCAENCVGALLERYIDSVLRPQDWHWCCGNFVKAIDFIKKTDNGIWIPVQIKNRNNTENSSSSAIRNGTIIQKWFRSFSKKKTTNWAKLPELMQGYELIEQGFTDFVTDYLVAEKIRRQQK